MVPGTAGPREILFLPRRNPAAETWTGHMYSAEEARKISGISEIWEAKEFEPFMQALRARRAYRPADANLLMSSEAAAAGTTQPVTPPVPKAEQTAASARAA